MEARNTSNLGDLLELTYSLLQMISKQQNHEDKIVVDEYLEMSFIVSLQRKYNHKLKKIASLH